MILAEQVRLNDVRKGSYANLLTPCLRREATRAEGRLNQKNLRVGHTALDTVLDCRQVHGICRWDDGKIPLLTRIRLRNRTEPLCTVCYDTCHALWWTCLRYAGIAGSWMSWHIQVLILVIDEALHSRPRFRYVQLWHSYARFPHFRRVELAEEVLSGACRCISSRSHPWRAALTFLLTGVVSTSPGFLA
jgi:hypothetical protein